MSRRTIPAPEGSAKTTGGTPVPPPTPFPVPSLVSSNLGVLSSLIVKEAFAIQAILSNHPGRMIVKHTSRYAKLILVLQAIRKALLEADKSVEGKKVLEAIRITHFEASEKGRISAPRSTAEGNVGILKRTVGDTRTPANNHYRCLLRISAISPLAAASTIS